VYIRVTLNGRTLDYLDFIFIFIRHKWKHNEKMKASESEGNNLTKHK